MILFSLLQHALIRCHALLRSQGRCLPRRWRSPKADGGYDDAGDQAKQGDDISLQMSRFVPLQKKVGAHPHGIQTLAQVPGQVIIQHVGDQAGDGDANQEQEYC